MGESDPAARGRADDAAVVRGSGARRVLERPAAVAAGHRHDRRVGGSRRREGGRPRHAPAAAVRARLDDRRARRRVQHARGVRGPGRRRDPVSVLHGPDELHRRQVDPGAGDPAGQPEGRASRDRLGARAERGARGDHAGRPAPAGGRGSQPARRDDAEQTGRDLSRRDGPSGQGGLEPGVPDALHAERRGDEGPHEHRADLREDAAAEDPAHRPRERTTAS